MHKIYIISDEIRENHPEFKNEKWICDILKEEFSQKFSNIVTTNELEATIIWYLAPWNFKYTPKSLSREKWLELLEKKRVIFTQHHIDNLKMDQLQTQFNFMEKYGNHIHAICNNTYEELKIYFRNTLISKKKLWINSNNFFEIKNKNSIREKYNIDKNSYLIGSFQKDTEGKTNLPKLSKGPDIFIDIVKDMYKTNKNIQVVLTGLRREYVINELKKLNIKYYYFNMISIKDINELYNCLDLYLVSSRCEGGPRSIFECGLTNTPIISTNVGIASELMNKKSIFDADNYITYKNAVPDNKFLKNNVELLSSKEYFNEFKDYIINC
jgi:glycosyltransferase involved in cell wall biosynthesis